MPELAAAGVVRMSGASSMSVHADLGRRDDAPRARRERGHVAGHQRAHRESEST